MPVQDIQMFHDEGLIVFNGPDEQFISGLTIGAVGGIGGTYAAMPELFLKARTELLQGNIALAAAIQNDICRIIYKLCSGHGNMYAIIKAVLRKQGGPDIGSVRKPLAPAVPADEAVIDTCYTMIKEAIEKYC